MAGQLLGGEIPMAGELRTEEVAGSEFLWCVCGKVPVSGELKMGGVAGSEFLEWGDTGGWGIVDRGSCGQSAT